MAQSLDTLFDMKKRTIREDPFPHVVVDDFFRPEVFAELKQTYPQIASGSRRKGWAGAIYWGDELYAQHLQEHPIWQTLFDSVHSQAFIDYIHDQFADIWKRDGCTIDFSKARFVSYCEDRSKKELMISAPDEHEPCDLWCRLDILQATEGYQRPMHLDHRRRLITMLVYFDSQEELEMEGGEIMLHRSKPDLDLLAKLGFYHVPRPLLSVRRLWSKAVAPELRPNRMVMFPCTRKSWHSVPVIRSLAQPRSFLHIIVSSSHDVWR